MRIQLAQIFRNAFDIDQSRQSPTHYAQNIFHYKGVIMFKHILPNVLIVGNERQAFLCRRQ